MYQHFSKVFHIRLKFDSRDAVVENLLYNKPPEKDLK